MYVYYIIISLLFFVTRIYNLNIFLLKNINRILFKKKIHLNSPDFEIRYYYYLIVYCTLYLGL
jgi:hypothetical protein